MFLPFLFSLRFQKWLACQTSEFVCGTEKQINFVQFALKKDLLYLIFDRMYKKLEKAQ